jgi:histidinol-phosphate aminotransferase
MPPSWCTRERSSSCAAGSLSAVRPLTGTIQAYDAPSTAEIAERVGLPVQQIVRFDGNTSPQALPSTRAEAMTEELGRVHTYPHGGYPELERSIADYAGVAPENIVLGAGADDLIMLLTRSFASPGDRVAIANDPTYPMYPISVWVAGAEVSDDDPVLTIACRPNNPTGELGELPAARPLVVDEAYFEYSGETAVDLIEDGVVVIRTFSKAFGLAGARVGYALAGRDVAAELNKRQHPAPVSTLSAALALAGLANPPDVSPILEERERMADRLRGLGFEPALSRANFLYVGVDDPQAEYDRLLRQGFAVRPVRGGIRITIRTQEDDDRLLRALA